MFVILILLTAVFPLSDIDECNTDDCSQLATCSNTDGSFVCECIGGYTGDGMLCTGNKSLKTNATTNVSVKLLMVQVRRETVL